MIRKIYFFVCLNLSLSLCITAQQSDNVVGKISGRIIDSISGQAIDYATISLLKQEDSKVVNGTTSDEKGVFKLTNVADGTYKMMVYFIGYKTGFKNNIVISNASQTVAIGD